MLKLTAESKGVFGSNIMVSEELRGMAMKLINTLKEVREESKDMEERAKVVITSAGDPVKMSSLIKDSGMVWGHVLPSVKHASRAVKAGVDFMVVSGQEGGFHGPWEPISSLVLLPAVCEEFPDIPVVGAGGYCDGKSLAATFSGDEEKSLFAGGECVQRIHDLPTSAEVVERTVKVAEETLRSSYEKYLS